MKINNNIPKMDSFISTEERMKLIYSINLLYKPHGKITFSDLYNLSNVELVALKKVITEHNDTSIEHNRINYGELQQPVRNNNILPF